MLFLYTLCQTRLFLIFDSMAGDILRNYEEDPVLTEGEKERLRSIGEDPGDYEKDTESMISPGQKDFLKSLGEDDDSLDV